MNWKELPWKQYTNSAGLLRYRQDHEWGVLIITKHKDFDLYKSQVEFIGLTPNFFQSDWCVTQGSALAVLEAYLELRGF